MASRSALIALLVAVSCAAVASAATTYTVGDKQGWTTGIDYTGWTSGKSFAVGDKLVFDYASGTHTVTEVSKSDYDSCSSSNSISSDNNGPTTVTLTAGAHYFVCAIAGHCAGGMKLAVTVAAADAGGGSPAAPATPSTPGTTTPPPSTPAASASAQAAAPGALAVAGVVLVKLALSF